MTREEDLPEGLQKLIAAWEDGDVSEDMFPALEKALRGGEKAMRKAAKVGPSNMPPGAMGTCEPVPSDNLSNQREGLETLCNCLAERLDEANFIESLLKGLVCGTSEGSVGPQQGDRDRIPGMNSILVALHDKELALGEVLYRIRQLVDGGSHKTPDGGSTPG